MKVKLLLLIPLSLLASVSICWGHDKGDEISVGKSYRGVDYMTDAAAFKTMLYHFIAEADGSEPSRPSLSHMAVGLAMGYSSKGEEAKRVDELVAAMFGLLQEYKRRTSLISEHAVCSEESQSGFDSFVASLDNSEIEVATYEEQMYQEFIGTLNAQERKGLSKLLDRMKAGSSVSVIPNDAMLKGAFGESQDVDNAELDVQAIDFANRLCESIRAGERSIEMQQD